MWEKEILKTKSATAKEFTHMIITSFNMTVFGIMELSTDMDF